MSAPWGFASEAVTVLRPVESGEDAMRNKTFEWRREEVGGVLVAPATASSAQVDRIDETRRRITLHFPKGYAADLRGCRVEVRGLLWSVVGSPQPYAEGNVPGPWSMPVDVEAVDG